MIHSMSRHLGAALAVLASSSALVACGGGGGSSEPAVQVNVSASAVSISYPSNTRPLNAQMSQVTATVVNPPTTRAYAAIQDSGHVTNGQGYVVANQDGSYTATVYYDLTLAPGTYTGTFQLKLCKDAACGSTYAVQGGSVAYTVTVTPTATFTATVNGVARTLQTHVMQGFADLPLTLELKAGDVVSLTASQPVSWGYSTSGAFASNVTQTTTTWTGTMQYGTSTPGATGTVDLDAAYLPDQQFSSAISLDVTQ